MFTPELVSSDRGEYVLVANHSLENEEAVRQSIRYNKARIAFGSIHLPPQISSFLIYYDIRGQSVTDTTILNVTQALEPFCRLEFKR